jgi:GNAT superfamily N-acetyltransferase
MPSFRLAKVRHAEQIAAVALLFREYVDWIGIDLGFQGFEAELAGLPGKYAPPTGELMLACSPAGAALGCVAVRPLEGETVCEMKRLYVRPAARGLRIGASLVAAIVRARLCRDEARHAALHAASSCAVQKLRVFGDSGLLPQSGARDGVSRQAAVAPADQARALNEPVRRSLAYSDNHIDSSSTRLMA